MRVRIGVSLAVASAALGGCMASLAPSSFAASAPPMRPEQFFQGTTTSSGVLETPSGAPARRLHVLGAGRILTDGALRLDQTVRFEGQPAERRTWILRRLDAHRYAGTLTDAAGPVRAQAFGDLFHLSYRTRSPPGGRMEQWLYLQSDGRTVVNEATITLLGVVVARLSERITHKGPPPPRG